MGRPQQTADLVKQKLPPSVIAKRLGISVSSVLNYAKTAVGFGVITRSDIVLSIDRTIRQQVDELLASVGVATPYEVSRKLSEAGVQVDSSDVAAYLEFRDAAMADLYELLRRIETALHGLIKRACIEEYGDAQWWRKGIPETIRSECAAMMERDPAPASEPYCYTTFIQLKEILDKRWALVSTYLPKEYANDKRKLLDYFDELNKIRNVVMHPVKGLAVGDEQFELVTLKCKLVSAILELADAQWSRKSK